MHTIVCIVISIGLPSAIRQQNHGNFATIWSIIQHSTFLLSWTQRCTSHMYIHSVKCILSDTFIAIGWVFYGSTFLLKLSVNMYFTVVSINTIILCLLQVWCGEFHSNATLQFVHFEQNNWILASFQNYSFAYFPSENYIWTCQFCRRHREISNFDWDKFKPFYPILDFVIWI